MDPALAFEVEEISKHRNINEAILHGESDVQRFYDDKVIFITGGSGFIGKQLIEKLLRSCNIKKIYMLMRPKKQKEIHERLQEALDDVVYDVLRKMKPDFTEKIIPVLGDIVKLNIGLSDEDRQILIREVDVIFHVAATINFTEPLKKATLTNIRGTRETLNLGLECKNLKAFVHVSTAYAAATYSHAGKDVVEKFYPTPVSPEALIEFVETLDETKLNNLTPALIQDYPNTYAFTKSVSEDLVRQREGKMPIAVIRPGIVIGAYREPSPGWIDKSAVFGASGFILGGGLGVLHVSLSKPSNYVSYVPVDMVNNATIIAGFNANKRWNKGQTDVHISTVVNYRNPVTIKKQSEILKRDGPKLTTDKAVYYPFHLSTSYKFIYYILTWIFHYIPGFIIDGFLRLLGKPPMLIKVYNKVYKLNGVLAYYMLYDWKFNDDNLVNMYKSLSPTDRIIYNCDIEELKWERFMIIWCIGIRKYIIKDGLKNTNYAKKKHFYLGIVHYIITPLYLYSLWKVFIMLFSVASTVFLFITSFIQLC